MARGPGLNISITAKRFAFTPDKITLKKGQTVKLRLYSEDVTHGFFLRPLKLDEEIPAGQTVEVTVTPQGTIRVPVGPGIGYEPRRERIEQLTVRREVLHA